MATPPLSQDPFYSVRAEIISQYDDIQRKLNRFHMITSSNPDRKSLAREVDADCDSIDGLLDMLTEAVDTAAQNPAQFNLTMEEIGSRRKWLTTQRRQVHGIKDSLKTMTAAAVHAAPTVAEKVVAANDSYLSSAAQTQDQLIRGQDDQLDNLAKGIDNVTAMGNQIQEHIKEDTQLLDEFGREIDTTQSRLKATTKKLNEIMRKNGSMGQLTIIIILVVIVAVLAYFVFA